NDDDGDSPMTQIIDSAMPQGDFTAMRQGTFVAQNGTPTEGMAKIGRDAESTPFLKFTSDFNTKFSTGTVTVYFSTSETLAFDAGNNNPDAKLVGITSEAGEQFFKLSGAVDSKFTHVILWCASANVPFGYAPLN
ncbi:MAG: DM13 domain-containing protein, partial [Bacteroidota bacterium]